VVNTIPLIIASYDHALWTVLNIHADPGEARGWIGQTLLDTFRSRYPGHVEELINAYVTFNLAHMDEMVERVPGMAQLLTELTRAGVSIGIATSKRRSSAAATLHAVGLETVIPITVAMDDTDAHKPDPAPLVLAADRLGHQPGECAYIGDAVVDVLAAQAAGMDPIAVTWGAGVLDELSAAGPSVLAATAVELREALALCVG
jgi:pyrophosphatase PpaX